jgi:hypothetical protein
MSGVHAQNVMPVTLGFLLLLPERSGQNACLSREERTSYRRMKMPTPDDNRMVGSAKSSPKLFG